VQAVDELHGLVELDLAQGFLAFPESHQLARNAGSNLLQ
jgi:hypothetical protein